MTDWIAAYVGTDLAPMVANVLLGLLAVVALLIIFWLFRRTRRGTFVSGGRNAPARISVQDAAPVDSHRRLILVRRDDVEHLLLIGGNTDIVVEQNIRLGGPSQRVLPPAEPVMRDRQIAREPVRYPAAPATPVHAVPPPVQPVAPPVQPVSQPRPPSQATPLRPAMQPAPAPLRTEPRMEPLAPAPQRVEPMAQPAAASVERRVEARVEPTRDMAPRADAVTSPTTERPGIQASQADLDDELEKMLGEFNVFAPQKA